MTNPDSILKSRDIYYFTDKGPSSQNYGYSSSHYGYDLSLKQEVKSK